MPVTPARNFRLADETMAQLEAIARREGLSDRTAAIRWLAAQDAKKSAAHRHVSRSRSELSTTIATDGC
jgi:hypothetical protein